MNVRSDLPIISSSSKPQRSLTRREVLERVFAGIGATLVAPLTAGAHPVMRHLARLSSLPASQGEENWAPQFLNARQNEMLIAISDRMLPGAGAAHVNRVIDLLMTVETDETRKLVTAALTTIEQQVTKQFHAEIAKLSPGQVDQVLAFCAEQEPPHAEHDDDAPGWKLNQRTPLTAAPNLRDHFENLKGWIVATYYSSEAGLRELGWNDEFYFESPEECAHPEGHE
jgi:gluconate 2-dehydrogenase subunit 3-like protein